MYSGRKICKIDKSSILSNISLEAKTFSFKLWKLVRGIFILIHEILWHVLHFCWTNCPYVANFCNCHEIVRATFLCWEVSNGFHKSFRCIHAEMLISHVQLHAILSHEMLPAMFTLKVVSQIIEVHPCCCWKGHCCNLCFSTPK